MMVSGGYPGDYEKGKVISGTENISNSLVFHAGTSLKNGKIVTDGGRVLAVSAYGNTQNEALQAAYNDASLISFEGKYYRKDLGFDL
jgi:phosphoribosylamine---glycine ligase